MYAGQQELQLHHANTTPTVTKYLQQNTEEMDLLSSPDATQRTGKQRDRFWKEKEGKTQERTGQGLG